MKTVKLLGLMCLGLLTSISASAQAVDLTPEASGLWEKTVAPLAPYILMIAFFVGAIFNLGKVTSKEDRDIKGFVIGILWFLGGCGAIITIIAFLGTLSVL